MLFCRKEPLMFQRRLQLYQLAAVVYSCHKPWCPSFRQQHQIQVCFKQSACLPNRIYIRFIKPHNPFATFITAGSAPHGTADRPRLTVQTLLDKLLVRDQSNVVSIGDKKFLSFASFSALSNLILCSLVVKKINKTCFIWSCTVVSVFFYFDITFYSWNASFISEALSAAWCTLDGA